MRIELAYGHGTIFGELTADETVERIAPPASPDVAEEDVIERALDAPIGAARLEDVARGARRVAILVSGRDRVACAEVYVPRVLERLSRAGVADEQIEVVCATGTHARHTPDDVRALIGPQAAARVRFRAHDCDREDGFADLGVSALGTPVRIDRGVVDADVRILTGRITHHYFAGFSGGRKSILPGVAARATIVANHRLVLDFSDGCRVHPGVFGGNLAGNPVHEDMLDAARRVGPCFVLNTLVDGAGRLSAAFAGELEAAHLSGCAEAERRYWFAPGRAADLVIASAGGWPYDVNFIQSIKGLFNHRAALRSGGVFVLVAEAAGGLLRGMRAWMAFDDRRALAAAMQARYDLAAHNTHLLREILDDASVILVSSMPADEVRSIGLIPAPTLDAALCAARERLGPNVRATVVHHGNVTWSGMAQRGQLIAGRRASAA